MTKFILLADSSAIEVTNFTLDQHFSVCCTKEEFLSLWERLTPENLSSVQAIVDGTVVARYSDCVLHSLHAGNLTGDKITGDFYLVGAPQKSVNEDYETAFNMIMEGGSNV